jgi:hypothetical protein
LGAHPAISSSIKALSPIVSMHHQHSGFLVYNLFQVSCKSIGEKEESGKKEEGREESDL